VKLPVGNKTLPNQLTNLKASQLLLVKNNLSKKVKQGQFLKVIKKQLIVLRIIKLEDQPIDKLGRNMINHNPTMIKSTRRDNCSIITCTAVANLRESPNIILKNMRDNTNMNTIIESHQGNSIKEL